MGGKTNDADNTVVRQAGNMSIRELLETIGRVLADAASKRFTGQISFTLHLRQGGVAKASVRREEDLHLPESGVPE